MARKAVKHPIGCRNFTVRYQWVAEMCGYRRTEADIVGVLIGYTEKYFEKSQKDGWDEVELSVSLLSRMACASVRSTQEALRWLEAHGIVHTTDRAGKGGLNLRRSYRLDLDLMDEVADMRDRLGVPVQVIRRGEGRATIEEIPGFGRKAATGVQKRRGTTMVQKSQGDGAEIAGYGAEIAPLEVQKSQGTGVQKSHPSYHGEESNKDPEYSIPALDTVEGDPCGNFYDYDPDEEDDSPRSCLLDFPNRGYRPGRKVSDLPPLKRTTTHPPGELEHA